MVSKKRDFMGWLDLYVLRLPFVSKARVGMKSVQTREDRCVELLPEGRGVGDALDAVGMAVDGGCGYVVAVALGDPRFDQR